MQQSIPQNNQSDSLGIKQLKVLLDSLAQIISNCQLSQNDRSKIDLSLSNINDSIETSLERFQLLKDRYSLLKRSNAALSDELIWLRDQLDDLQIYSDDNNE
jgi:archaellum component FlaC